MTTAIALTTDNVTVAWIKRDVNQIARDKIGAGEKRVIVDNSLNTHVSLYPMVVTNVYNEDDDSTNCALGVTDNNVPCVLFL